MALTDDSVINAATEAALDSWLPPTSELQYILDGRPTWRPVLRAIVRGILTAITEHATVHSNGSPPMTADGDPVVGFGRIE